MLSAASDPKVGGRFRIRFRKLNGSEHECSGEFLEIGMDCLRRFARVSIDYGRKELRFEVANAWPVQPLQAELPPPLDG